MARQRKGRPISGWIIVDKPSGVTSSAVVNKVRWALQAQKAGHAGTLDPDATGVLVVALGEATKIIPYIMDALKSYHFRINWGAATDTDDASGTVIETSTLRPEPAQIEALLPQFTGSIMQTPPAYSAVKVDGARAYSLARAGTAPELEARPLFVKTLRLIEMPDRASSDLEMICGKGGYVRAIARDLGRELGCLGHVQSLRRLWSGPFDLSMAITWAQIEQHARTEDMAAYLRPVEVGLVDLPRVEISQISAQRLRNGNPAEVLTAPMNYGDTCWAAYDGQPIAIGTYVAGMLKPSRVLRL